MAKIIRDSRYVTAESVSNASKVKVEASIKHQLKVNANTTSYLDDGEYDGVIADIQQGEGKPYASIQIYVNDVNANFRSVLFLNSVNQPLAEIYKVLGEELNFEKLLGASIEFSVKNRNSGSSTFSNIIDLHFQLAPTNKSCVEPDSKIKTIDENNFDELMYMDEE